MDQLESLIDRLNQPRRLRVWSIIITLFGDAIACRGGAVSAKTVQDILDSMRIEAGTVRTAFSRLTRDGWVLREKIGRASHYRLSPSGRVPFVDATRRIYAPYQGHSDNQTFIEFHQNDYPNPRFVVRNDEDISTTEGDVFSARLSEISVPEWMSKIIASKEHENSLTSIIDKFSSVVPEKLEPIDSLAIRCLLIHEWRRHIFQFPPIPLSLCPDNWPAENCHRLIAKLYGELLPKSEHWLDTFGTGPEGRLPAPNENLSQRLS